MADDRKYWKNINAMSFFQILVGLSNNFEGRKERKDIDSLGSFSRQHEKHKPTQKVRLSLECKDERQ